MIQLSKKRALIQKVLPLKRMRSNDQIMYEGFDFLIQTSNCDAFTIHRKRCSVSEKMYSSLVTVVKRGGIRMLRCKSVPETHKLRKATVATIKGLQVTGISTYTRIRTVLTQRRYLTSRQDVNTADRQTLQYATLYTLYK